MIMVAAGGILIGNLVNYVLPFICKHFFLLTGSFIFLVVAAWYLKWKNFIFIFLLSFLLGFVRTGLDQHDYLSLRLADSIHPFTISLRGVIKQIVKQTSEQVVFIFVPNAKQHPLLTSTMNMQLNWVHPSVYLHANQNWQFTVRIQPLHRLINIGGPIHDRFFIQNIHARGTVKNPSPLILASNFSWSGKLNAIRDRFTDKIQASDLQFSGVLSALAVGMTNGIPTAHWDVFRRTGTAHLLAISGLHIGLCASAVASVVTWCWRRFPFGCQRWPAILVGKLIGLLFAVLYCAAAGFAIATLRAVLMLALWSGATLLQRRYLSIEPLALSLMGCILLTPRATLQAGFWLSFVAVALLLSVTHGQVRRRSKLAQQNSSQRQLFWGMLPFGIIFFQHYALFSPLANLIAIPWFSVFIVPLTLLATIVNLLSESGCIFLLKLANFALQIIWPVLEWFSTRPLAYFSWSVHSVWMAFAMICGLFMTCLPTGMPGRVLGWVLFLSQFFEIQTHPRPGEFYLRLFDVGQGLSAIIHTQHHTLLFDTGGRFSEYDSAQQVILPYLQHERITHLDAIVISHPDMDHRGGFQSLVAHIPVNSVWSSFTGLKAPQSAQDCHRTDPWVWDGVQFTFLSLPNFASTNNHSCVLRVSTPVGAVLLPGDIEATAEHWLVTHYPGFLPADVLIAPHHGSRTSSTQPFIQAVRPHVVWYATGFQNRYGFPHPEVKKRYEKQGVRGYNTAFDGMLRATLTRRGWIFFPPFRNSKCCNL